VITISQPPPRTEQNATISFFGQVRAPRVWFSRRALWLRVSSISRKQPVAPGAPFPFPTRGPCRAGSGSTSPDARLNTRTLDSNRVGLFCKFYNSPIRRRRQDTACINKRTFFCLSVLSHPPLSVQCFLFRCFFLVLFVPPAYFCSGFLYQEDSQDRGVTFHFPEVLCPSFLGTRSASEDFFTRL